MQQQLELAGMMMMNGVIHFVRSDCSKLLNAKDFVVVENVVIWLCNSWKKITNSANHVCNTGCANLLFLLWSLPVSLNLVALKDNAIVLSRWWQQTPGCPCDETVNYGLDNLQLSPGDKGLCDWFMCMCQSLRYISNFKFHTHTHTHDP